MNARNTIETKKTAALNKNARQIKVNDVFGPTPAIQKSEANSPQIIKMENNNAIKLERDSPSRFTIMNPLKINRIGTTINKKNMINNNRRYT